RNGRTLCTLPRARSLGSSVSGRTFSRPIDQKRAIIPTQVLSKKLTIAIGDGTEAANAGAHSGLDKFWTNTKGKRTPIHREPLLPFGSTIVIGLQPPLPMLV